MCFFSCDVFTLSTLRGLILLSQPHLKLPEVRMGQGFGGFRCRSRERRLRRLDSSSICFVWFISLITPWLTLFCSPSSFFLPTVAPMRPFYLIRNKNFLQQKTSVLKKFVTGSLDIALICHNYLKVTHKKCSPIVHLKF